MWKWIYHSTIYEIYISIDNLTRGPPKKLNTSIAFIVCKTLQSALRISNFYVLHDLQYIREI